MHALPPAVASSQGRGRAEDDLQPHVLSTNTLTPTSEELLMKTCVSSSSACQTQRRCWMCGRSAAEVGDSVRATCCLCGRGRVPMAVPCLTAGTGPTDTRHAANMAQSSCKTLHSFHGGIWGQLVTGTVATREVAAASSPSAANGGKTAQLCLLLLPGILSLI